jgi:serine/threonine protein kinase
MSASFDPYYEWLSIPPEDQPANFYRLLGVKLLEANPQVLNSAADRQMAHVRTFANGPKAGLAQRVLNELSGARVVLLDPARKAAYDAMLRAASAEQEESRANIAKEPPLEAIATKGNTFGDYLVLHVISQAATGTIYKAQRISDGQIVSLKVIPKDLAKSEEFLKRLKREFEITKSVDHPHVVAGYELGEAQGRPYLVFEYVGGADLGRIIAEHGPLQVPAAIEISKRVADGLAYLHQKGIVHRNLKPQNILVNVQGAVKIANLTMAMEDDARAFLGGHERNLTVTGQVIGSPDYIAPEQAVDSHAIDGRADLYSLGCTLHHLLTGRPPYGGKNPVQKLTAHRTAAIPKLSEVCPAAPEWLDELFQQLLAKKPADRPPSARDVEQRLAGRAEKRSHTMIVVVSAAVVAVILFLIVLAVLNR